MESVPNSGRSVLLHTAGEVSRLQLGDINWEEESIFFTRSKRLGSHSLPLVQSVGNSIIRYLKDATPPSPHREVFLTVRAPFHPLTVGTLWPVVGVKSASIPTPAGESTSGV
jgi:integrase/recombinase XerD